MPNCARCNREISIDEAKLVHEEFYCSECCETAELRALMAAGEAGPESAAEAAGDRCIACQKPLLSLNTKRYSGQSYCEACFARLTHFPIPLWVKAFALALAALVAVGFLYNSRFYRAIFSIKSARSSLSAGKIDEALALSEKALRLVPESGEIQLMHEYYEGLSLYTKNKSDEALPLLLDYVHKEPGDSFIKTLVLNIQLGQAFDARDYVAMSDRAKELWTLDRTDAMATLQYASALACLFVSTSDRSVADQARRLVEDARKLIVEKDRDQLEGYIKRIEYRIDKKKIISTEEYLRLGEEQRK